MPLWLQIFIAVAAAAVTIQTIIIVSALLALRPIATQLSQIATDLQAKVNPVILAAGRILIDSEERLKSIAADGAAMTHTARTQVENVDRVVTDAVEKLRIQIIHTDQMVTGTLEAMEDAGTKVRRSVLTPVNQFSAILKGLKVGLETIRGGRSAHSDGVPQDEELFI